MIGEREFRFVDDEDLLFLVLDRWEDDDLDLFLHLVFVVTDDCVVIKAVGDLRVGDVRLELLFLRSLLFILEELLFLFLEEDEDSFNISWNLCCCCLCRCCDDEDSYGNDLDRDLV